MVTLKSPIIIVGQFEGILINIFLNRKEKKYLHSWWFMNNNYIDCLTCIFIEKNNYKLQH
jgi:hypothetical protein